MKKFITVLLSVMILSSLIRPVYAEETWTFSDGVFKTETISFSISNQFSKTIESGDFGLCLSDKKESMSLFIFLVSYPDATMDLIESNVEAKDENFIGDFLGSILKPDVKIINHLLSVSRRRQGNLEILEYRFDVNVNDTDCISYFTFIQVNNSDQFCVLCYLAGKTLTQIEKLYYINIIDSAVKNDDNTKKNFVPVSPTNTPKPASTSTPTPTESSKNKYSNTAKSSDLPSLSGPFSGQTVKVLVKDKIYTLHKDFKTAMDKYQTYFDSYINLLKSIEKSDADYFIQYADLMKKYIEVAEALEYLDNLENDDLTKDEQAYLIYVVTDISARLLTAMN